MEKGWRVVDRSVVPNEQSEEVSRRPNGRSSCSSRSLTLRSEATKGAGDRTGSLFVVPNERSEEGPCVEPPLIRERPRAGSLAFARDDISRRPRCRSLTPRSAATRGAGDRDVALQGPSSRLARIKVPPLQSRTPNLEKPLPRAYNAVAGRIWKHKPLFSGYAIPRRTYRRGILCSVASNPRLSAKEPPRCGIPSSLSSFKTTRRNHKGGRTPSLDRERTTRTGRRS